MNSSGLYDEAPARVSFDELKDSIETRDQLYLVERQLRRINRGDALRPVEANGTTMPYYLKHEVDIATRSANRRRRKIRDELYPNWDDMSPQSKARAISNRNIADLHADYTAQGLRDIWGERHWYDSRKLDLWLNVWRRYSSEIPGYSQTVAIIERFMKNRQTALYTILESDYDEKEPEYIYPERTPYMGIPFPVRQSNAVRFWAQMADRYNLYEGRSMVEEMSSNRWDEVVW